MNTNLQTLISMQQTTRGDLGAATRRLAPSRVNGNTATLSNATSSPATWSLNAAAPATANITITSSSRQTAYTGTCRSTPERKPSPGTAKATTA